MSKLVLPLLVLSLIAATQAFNIWWYLHQHVQLPGFLPHPVNELRHFSFALVFVVAGLVWLKAGAPLYHRLLRPFVWFAPISYGIYICHDSVMRGAGYLDIINQPVLEWFACFAIVLAMSALIELLIYPMLKNKLQPVIEGLFRPPALVKPVAVNPGGQR